MSLSENENQIICPSCEHSFAVEDILTHRYEEKLKTELNKSRAELKDQFAQKTEELALQKRKFEEYKENEKQIFYQRLEKEKAIASQEISETLQKKFQHQNRQQQREVELLHQKLRKSQDTELELQQLKRKMELQQKEIELKYEQQLHRSQKEMEDTISKRLYQEVDMKMKDKDKQLEDQKKLIAEMQRKAEQGSMQLQGEVQELAVEEWLNRHFPFDDIDEIKKGARGADCKQLVHTRLQKNCGTIYYESKRTKEFQPAWIDKFKQDMIHHNADIGVIVTQVMPKDMDRMGQKNGIWVCTYEEFKSLCFILRQMLIKVGEVSDSERNKGDKMNMLYRYLTSNEFKMKIETIVDGFTQMQDNLQKEKNAMFRIWSQREKHIQRVLINTTEMYGDIKGIAGQEIPNVRQLELPIHDEEVFDLKDESEILSNS